MRQKLEGRNQRETELHWAFAFTFNGDLKPFFSNSDFAVEDRHQQLCVNIQFAKETVRLHGCQGSALPVGKCQETWKWGSVWTCLTVCPFFNPSEAKERRRLPLPAHLVGPGNPQSSLLFCERGPAPQTGEGRAASHSSAPAWNALGPVGKVPGEETKEEPRGEPVRSPQVPVGPLAFGQGAHGFRPRPARARSSWPHLQGDPQLLRRPPAGAAVQRARQPHQNQHCRSAGSGLRQGTPCGQVDTQVFLNVPTEDRPRRGATEWPELSSSEKVWQHLTSLELVWTHAPLPFNLWFQLNFKPWARCGNNVGLARINV